VKLSLKKLAFSNADPGGVAISSGQPLIIEPRHLSSNDSRPGDLYAVAGGLHAKDAAMDLMVTSSISISTLLHTSKSSDYAPRLEENKARSSTRTYATRSPFNVLLPKGLSLR
jgi:hypothetical protein